MHPSTSWTSLEVDGCKNGVEVILNDIDCFALSFCFVYNKRSRYLDECFAFNCNLLKHKVKLLFLHWLPFFFLIDPRLTQLYTYFKNQKEIIVLHASLSFYLNSFLFNIGWQTFIWLNLSIPTCKYYEIFYKWFRKGWS